MLGATDRRFERWEALPALAVAGLLLLWAVPAMIDVSPRSPAPRTASSTKPSAPARTPPSSPAAACASKPSSSAILPMVTSAGRVRASAAQRRKTESASSTGSPVPPCA